MFRECKTHENEIIAYVNKGKGHVLAFRADMDALNISKETGNQGNAYPESATLSGTVRTFDVELSNRIEKKNA